MINSRAVFMRDQVRGRVRSIMSEAGRPAGPRIGLEEKLFWILAVVTVASLVVTLPA